MSSLQHTIVALLVTMLLLAATAAALSHATGEAHAPGSVPGLVG
jgi:hypothetical protein